jgi:hypothetical protein
VDFGIMTAKVDEIGYITRAENLGFTHAWVTDSPMIRSNCWAVLTLNRQYRVIEDFADKVMTRL